MKDVSAEFDEYREASRHLRNTYFKRGDWESVEWFERIDQLLLEVLILRPLFVSHSNLPKDFLEPHHLSTFFRIVPESDGAVPVMISRSSAQEGYWDHPVTALTREAATIALLEVFDWDQVGFRDMRYYMGRITASKNFPEIVGHRILVECSFAKVFFTSAHHA